MKGFRIIGSERLHRVLRANGRHVAQRLAVVGEKRDLEAKLRLADQENAALLLENQMLLDAGPLPPLTPSARERQLRVALHRSQEQARRLDERLAVLQAANEAGDRQLAAARVAAPPVMAAAPGAAR